MARNVGVNFNGKHIIHPGAWSRINASALNDSSVPDSRRIVFLGSSEGGTPNQLMWFTNPSDAREVLRSGDLLTAGELAWNPGVDGIGAGTIGFIRVQNATRASLTQGNMTITSKDYGAWTNQIQVKLENGTIAGSKKITVYQWKDNVTEVFDNLGTIFDIQYTGTQPYASLTITTSNGKATNLTVKVGADAGSATPVLNYALGAGQWNDLLTLVNDINQHAGFTATVKPTGDKTNITTDMLDAVNSQDIKTAPYTVTAMQGDIQYQINNLSKYVTVSFATGTFPTNFPFTYLTGGSDGTVPTSWASFYDLIRTSGAYLVVPLTIDPSLQAECNNFINTQESARVYLMGIYGSDVNDTVDQAINRAVSLNSSRAVVTYPAIQTVAQDGSLQTLPGYMTAALVAGRIAGQPTGEPITFDYVNVAGLSQILKPADIDRLLQGGVTPLEFVRYNDRAGYRIAQGITAWQVDGNPSFREISMRIISDTLSSELAEILETKFVGGKGTISTVALIKNEVQSFLDRKVREEVLVEYDPASVTVNLNGETVYVNYAVMPVGSLNYILLTTTYYQKPISV